MTIKFIGNEIGDIIGDTIVYKGFETSFELMRVVSDGYYKEQLAGKFYGINYIEIGDYLFDYETGTMWEVVE